MKLRFTTCLLLSLMYSGLSNAQSTVKLNSNTFGEIKARHIGPATMSGRISAIDVVADNPHIAYFGSAGGGLWKTENGGIKVKAVFDDYTQSIGAIAIVQSHPDTVYVGTGESWVRNSVSVGDGIYKTTDGGDTWKNIGLKETERISRIVIHPENPDIVFVAAMGHLWDSNEERGVYRTTDGGNTWEKVLYVDENTGASDISINPQNPDILYAGMWDYRRKPYTFRSGGPGSGLYKSTDGGNTWSRLSQDLPETELGRISVAVSPVKPDMVYALIEAEVKKGGLYRSDDDGATWKLVNKTGAITERPFYFSQIYPDPVDTMRVYKPSFDLSVSENGGENFRIAYVGGGRVHSDQHAFWIGKKDNKLMFVGTDGGVYRSIDQGKTWSMLRNIPVSQFYHVSVDNEIPYNVYGGIQDNGSWMAPSRSPGGIEISDWENIGYGDGFYMFADREDPNILYWQSQGGNFVRFYRNTGEMKEIKPYGDGETGKLRWNWNASIAFSPTTDAMYVGSQYLYRSTDKGDSWERISPDLTTNDPERLKQYESGGITVDNSTAENNCTIYTIGESPLDPGVIWAGTDDGRLHVTKDGGKTWTDVTGNVPGVGTGNWVSSVEPGKYDKGTIFVTFDNHREGDMKPYIFKSTDFGSTFTSLVDENIEGYCFDVLQDPVSENLLFLGTEFGLYASIDSGVTWSRFKGNLPKVAVHEIVIQPREHDLVLATHGRGILIIDDLTPLRALNPDILNEDLAFLPSKPYLISSMANKQTFPGDDEFTGQNPADAVYITYYLKKRHVFGDMYIEIWNNEGEKLTEIPAGKRKGINRESWVPRKKPPKVPASNNLSRGAIFGPNYPPGEYTVKIVKGEDVFEGKVQIAFDPLLPHSDSDKELQLKTLSHAYDLLEELAFLDTRITGITKQLDTYMEEGLKASSQKKLKEYYDALESIHETLVETKMGGITGEEQLRDQISGIYGAVMSYYGKPTQSQIDRLEILDKELMTRLESAKPLFNEGLKKANAILEKEGKEKIVLLSREEFEKSK